MAAPVLQSRWQLRPAGSVDVAALHRLTSDPLVFRFLFDGQAPVESEVHAWLAASIESFREHGVGIWILSCRESACAGFVSLSRRQSGTDAELTYALDPGVWGRGLATRMALSAARKGFSAPSKGRIVAGADRPNTASIAVLERIGMRFRSEVDYPLGPGVEYELGPDDRPRRPSLEPIPIAGAPAKG